MLSLVQGQDDGTSTMAVPDYLRDREGEKALGVYALYNAHNDVQYIGYSRNMVLAVKVRVLLCLSPCFPTAFCYACILLWCCCC